MHLYTSNIYKYENIEYRIEKMGHLPELKKTVYIEYPRSVYRIFFILEFWNMFFVNCQMDIFQIVIPLKSFGLSKISPIMQHK